MIPERDNPLVLYFFFCHSKGPRLLWILIKILGTAIVNGDSDLEIDHRPVWRVRSRMPPKRGTKAPK